MAKVSYEYDIESDTHTIKIRGQVNVEVEITEKNAQELSNQLSSLSKASMTSSVYNQWIKELVGENGRAVYGQERVNKAIKAGIVENVYVTDTYPSAGSFIELDPNTKEGVTITNTFGGIIAILNKSHHILDKIELEPMKTELCIVGKCDHRVTVVETTDDVSYDKVEYHFDDHNMATILVTGNEKEIIEVGKQSDYVLDNDPNATINYY